jgi:MFS family permease
MNAAATPAQAQRALRFSLGEAMFHAAMLGLSESWLGAFAVALGHEALALALLATVPLLVGALAQLVASPLATMFRGRKQLVIAGAVVQAFAQIGFVAIAATGERRLWPLLLVKTIFWTSGAVIAPAWGAWMGALTEHGSRSRYFAVRSSLAETALLLAFGGAGVWLHGADPSESLGRFTAMFVVALVARTVSAAFLVGQWDPGATTAETRPPIVRSIAEAATSSRWRTAVYLGVMMFGGHVAIPFFTPYMLRVLHLDFGTFAFLLSLSIFAKAVSFPLCHRIADRIGLRRLLVVSGIGVAALPLFWAVFSDVWLLVLVQLVGGATWAGLEYASFQLLLQSSRAEHRLEFLSLASSLSGALQLAGALTGSALLGGIGYAGLFVASALLRGIALVVLVVAVRHLELAARVPRVFVRLLGTRPNAGAIRTAVLEDRPSAPASRRDRE